MDLFILTGAVLCCSIILAFTGWRDVNLQDGFSNQRSDGIKLSDPLFVLRDEDLELC